MDYISSVCKRRKPALPWRLAWQARLLAGLLSCLGAGEVAAVTLEQLVGDPGLTPERLLRQVAGFQFRLGQTVQTPSAFLACQAGDCDDFARLAAEVLGRRGYTTRLVVVHMDREVHVVCYVNEIEGYLDFNRREESRPVVACACRLGDVADKVAASLRSRWRTASEFTYEAGRPKYLLTVFR